jgi:cell division protein ZapA
LAQVTVKINGYSYTVGCEDGQEDHLMAMSQQVESRIESIKSLGGQSGESRLLVLAALLMADELHDVRAELDEVRSSPARAAQPHVPDVKDTDTRKRITKLAARAEQIAEQLDQP